MYEFHDSNASPSLNFPVDVPMAEVRQFLPHNIFQECSRAAWHHQQGKFSLGHVKGPRAAIQGFREVT